MIEFFKKIMSKKTSILNNETYDLHRILKTEIKYE